MSEGQEWPSGNKPVESSDGRNANPPIQDFFGSWTNQALGELKLWLEQENELNGISGIRFNFDNQGGSLIVTANDPIPGTDNGIEFITTGGLDIEITSDGNLDLTADILKFHGGTFQTVMGGGSILTQDSDGLSVFLSAGKRLLVTDHLSADLLTIGEGGGMDFVLRGGSGSFSITDSAPSSIFSVTEDGSVDIDSSVGPLTVNVPEIIFLNLPTSAGTSASLYVDALGYLKVSP